MCAQRLVRSPDSIHRRRKGARVNSRFPLFSPVKLAVMGGGEKRLRLTYLCSCHDNSVPVDPRAGTSAPTLQHSFGADTGILPRLMPSHHRSHMCCVSVRTPRPGLGIPHGRQTAREILEPVYRKMYKSYDCKDICLARSIDACLPHHERRTGNRLARTRGAGWDGYVPI